MTGSVRDARSLRIAWTGSPPVEGGGVPGVAYQLIEGLLARGHVVDCYVADGGGALPGPLVDAGLGVVSSGGTWQWGRWYSRTAVAAFAFGLAFRAWGQRQLTHTLVRRHADVPYDVVYQFSNIEMPGLKRHRSKLPPIVLHPETHAAGELRWYLREAALRRRCEPRWKTATVRPILEIRKFLQRDHARHADLVVCISESFREELVADYRIERSRTVLAPNPIDLDTWTFEDHAPGRPSSIVFVSRMSARKGVEQVVALSHRLADLEGVVDIKFIGGYTQWSDYRPLLDDIEPRVATVLGPLPHDEVRHLVTEADLLIQPSKYEPFGLTVGEALAAGTPVVATSAVGATDFVHGSAVLTTPVDDLDALEQGVRRMLRDSATVTGLRAAARAEAERSFSQGDVVGTIEAALVRLSPT